MPVSTVTGPMTDHVVVLLIGLPPSTPNPCNAQIRPNSATINPNAKLTTKALFIKKPYAPQTGFRAYDRKDDGPDTTADLAGSDPTERAARVGSARRARRVWLTG